jgi:hypothetical protein
MAQAKRLSDAHAALIKQGQQEAIAEPVAGVQELLDLTRGEGLGDAADGAQPQRRALHRPALGVMWCRNGL